LSFLTKDFFFHFLVASKNMEKVININFFYYPLDCKGKKIEKSVLGAYHHPFTDIEIFNKIV